MKDRKMYLIKPREAMKTLQILMKRPNVVITKFHTKMIGALGPVASSISIEDTEEFLRALKALKTFNKEHQRYYALLNY